MHLFPKSTRSDLVYLENIVVRFIRLHHFLRNSTTVVPCRHRHGLSLHGRVPTLAILALEPDDLLEKTIQVKLLEPALQNVRLSSVVIDERVNLLIRRVGEAGGYVRPVGREEALGRLEDEFVGETWPAFNQRQVPK
jgi:hypothetical protein